MPRLRIQLLLLALVPVAWTRLPAAATTGVTFRTSDAALQQLYDRAESKAASNIVQFTPAMKVLVEGGGYGDAWIETQPMGGEMYAKRNLEVGLNNQLIFMQGQRADGRLPGMVVAGETARKNGWDQHPPEGMIWLPGPGILADFEMLQGYCFPDPAWKMYFWTGKDKGYLAELSRAMERHDAYLWRTRDSNGDGLLESWCLWDTGEDDSTRLLSRHVPMRWPFEFPPPREQGLIASMDLMSYSYAGRATLAKIARELGTGREAYWQRQAEEVRQRLIKGLWNPARHACFDRDRTGQPMPELVHNNLRAMYFGVFTQKMADEFIKYHLLNPDEFWTPLPLPSIAIHEPLYRNDSINNWSGQPQGLTYQRAIRALENYAHYAEVARLGEIFLKVLIRNGDKFTQQYDPITGQAAAASRDGYGPTILAALEYISRMHGIALEVEQQQVWWSGLNAGGEHFTYTQRWGDRLWQLDCQNGILSGHLNGKELFSCTAGVRVVTDFEGAPREVVGIDSVARAVELQAAGVRHKLRVSPNQVIAIGAAGPKQLRAPKH